MWELRQGSVKELAQNCGAHKVARLECTLCYLPLLQTFPNCSVINHLAAFIFHSSVGNLKARMMSFSTFSSLLSGSQNPSSINVGRREPDKHLSRYCLRVPFLGQLIRVHFMFSVANHFCVQHYEARKNAVSAKFLFWVKIVSIPKGKIIATLTDCIGASLPLAALSCASRWKVYLKRPLICSETNSTFLRI